MSNVLAIAAVTQVLKDLLNDALINGDASQVLGSDFTVTALPPDRVVSEDPTSQQTRLNLFLHRVTPNAAMRNSDLPTRNADGSLKRRPRLALDLHYILTAVSSEELHSEILLGYAMQLFHETAVLPRETIRAALEIAGMDQILAPAFDLIRVSEVADQIELLKITPHSLSMDDMSKMWTALQASYRTTVAYDVSLVLIERELPIRPSLPVLSRGGLPDPVTGRDPGVALQPDLNSTVPTLLSVEPADGQQVMRLGGEVHLVGAGLDRGEATVEFRETGTGNVLSLAPLLPVAPHRMTVSLPGTTPVPPAAPLSGTASDPTQWRIGPYVIEVVLRGIDGRDTRTNGLATTLAPRTTPAVAAVPGGTEFTMPAAPPIRAGQTVAVLAGQEMAVLPAPTTPTDSVQAVIAGLNPGADVPVRLRVDGIESPIIDRLAVPPALTTVTVP